jgi:hypothetical protein
MNNIVMPPARFALVRAATKAARETTEKRHQISKYQLQLEWKRHWIDLKMAQPVSAWITYF